MFVPDYLGASGSILNGMLGLQQSSYQQQASLQSYLQNAMGQSALNGLLSQQNAIKLSETSLDRRLRLLGEGIAKIEQIWAGKIAALKEQDEAFAVEPHPNKR